MHYQQQLCLSTKKLRHRALCQGCTARREWRWNLKLVWLSFNYCMSCNKHTVHFAGVILFVQMSKLRNTEVKSSVKSHTWFKREDYLGTQMKTALYASTTARSPSIHVCLLTMKMQHQTTGKSTGSERALLPTQMSCSPFCGFSGHFSNQTLLSTFCWLEKAAWGSPSQKLKSCPATPTIALPAQPCGRQKYGFHIVWSCTLESENVSYTAKGDLVNVSEFWILRWGDRQPWAIWDDSEGHCKCPHQGRLREFNCRRGSRSEDQNERLK